VLIYLKEKKLHGYWTSWFIAPTYPFITTRGSRVGLWNYPLIAFALEAALLVGGELI